MFGYSDTKMTIHCCVDSWHVDDLISWYLFSSHCLCPSFMQAAPNSVHVRSGAAQFASARSTLLKAFKNKNSSFFGGEQDPSALQPTPLTAHSAANLPFSLALRLGQGFLFDPSVSPKSEHVSTPSATSPRRLMCYVPLEVNVNEIDEHPGNLRRVLIV